MDEQQLEGGIANRGKVVRVGQHVLRPATPNTESVHELLRALRSAGFSGAPKPFGIDQDGRERLEFIEGDVPLTPYPSWCQTNRALASVAKLMRTFHEAVSGFQARGMTWNDALADPAGGTSLCHNDVELSNVVFRSGVAVAFIDFEFAAPGRPVYDLAQLARLCVPIEDDIDKARMGWEPADGPARLRLIADAYGLDLDGRLELPGALEDAIDRIESAARGANQEGGALANAVSAKTGGVEKYDRRREWWLRHKDSFADALR